MNANFGIQVFRYFNSSLPFSDNSGIAAMPFSITLGSQTAKVTIA